MELTFIPGNRTLDRGLLVSRRLRISNGFYPVYCPKELHGAVLWLRLLLASRGFPARVRKSPCRQQKALYLSDLPEFAALLLRARGGRNQAFLVVP